MSDYSTLDLRVAGLVQDQSGYLTGNDHEDAMREALDQYGRDAARLVIEDLAGDGDTFDFSLNAATFAAGFSTVRRVEYPAGQRPALSLEPGDYELYQSATSTKLRLRFVTPASGETVRVTYSARHTIDGLDNATATTIPSWHEAAVVALAASRLLERLASRFLYEQEATVIQADAIDRQSKSDLAAKRARALEADYKAILGVTSGVPAAGVTVDWDTTFSGSGIDYLTHPARWR